MPRVCYEKTKLIKAIDDILELAMKFEQNHQLAIEKQKSKTKMVKLQSSEVEKKKESKIAKLQHKVS